MIAGVLKALKGGKDLEELQALCARLIAENDALRVENALLRRENAYLQRKVKDAELRILRRAQADALLIGSMHFGHVGTSRAACLEYGISRRRWTWAMALLQCAHVRTTKGDWHQLDIAQFDGRLASAVKRIEDAGMQALHAWLPRNGFSGKHGGTG